MNDSIVNVARFLPEMARRVPTQNAVRIPDGRTSDGAIRYLERTFEQLDRESDATVRLLGKRNVGRGDRVLLMVRPGLDLILVTFALFKIGAVPVVIDPGMGLRNFLHCVKRTTPSALVGIPLAQIISRLFPSCFGSVKTRVTAGTQGFLRNVGQCESGDRGEIASTAGDDLAAILFTSGSTGPPKGVCYEHGMFEAQVRMIRNHYGIEPGEVDLPMLPVFALFCPAFGMTCVVPEMNPSRPARVDPAKIVQAIVQNEVTNSFGSPVLWTKIGRYCREHEITLPSIRRILMAGAPVSPAVIEMFQSILPNGEIHTPYGATECLPVSSINGTRVLNETWSRTEKGEGTCVGSVFAENTVRIIATSDRPVSSFREIDSVEPGTIGEIAVHGPVATRVYDRVEEETRKAKITGDDGAIWHRMGDLGYIDGNGDLWFCGRKVERVQASWGEMYTDCCEAIFNKHEKVFRSALIGQGESGGQIPAIVIEPEIGRWPGSKKSRRNFVRDLRKMAQSNPLTEKIETFYFSKKFPVDVRHNAKIHRLTLARKFAQKK